MLFVRVVMQRFILQMDYSHDYLATCKVVFQMSHAGSSVNRSARKSSMLRNVAGMCLREA